MSPPLRRGALDTAGKVAIGLVLGMLLAELFHARSAATTPHENRQRQPAAADQTVPPTNPQTQVADPIATTTVHQQCINVATPSPLFPDYRQWIDAYTLQIEGARRAGVRGSRALAKRHLTQLYFDELQRHLALGVTVDLKGCEVMGCTYPIGPLLGHTMLPPDALANIRHTITAASRGQLPGVFVEAGAWRGGGSVFARFVMDTLGFDRHLYVADSFAGLPKARNASGNWENFYEGWKLFAVPVHEVQATFRHYNKLDVNKVHFVKGFFVDSMPVLRNELLQTKRSIAVLRADGDMYDSTIDILYNLYDLVDVGGFIIIDDFRYHENTTKFGARTAVLQFRQLHGIEDEAHAILPYTPRRVGNGGVFWRKARQVELRRDLYLNHGLEQASVAPEEMDRLRQSWIRHAMPWPPEDEYDF